jgi:hypothetical protein
MQIDPHVRLAGILNGCPFDAPLEQCAFNPIRQETLAERMRWLNGLQEQERRRFVNLHADCIIQRENQLLG